MSVTCTWKGFRMLTFNWKENTTIQTLQTLIAIFTSKQKQSLICIVYAGIFDIYHYKQISLKRWPNGVIEKRPLDNSILEYLSGLLAISDSPCL